MEDSAFPESIPPENQGKPGVRRLEIIFFEEKSKKSREKFGGIKRNP